MRSNTLDLLTRKLNDKIVPMDRVTLMRLNKLQSERDFA